jgi:DHA1 family bicyclomycin/chloramphenicol resistance-like MFS transporter
MTRLQRFELTIILGALTAFAPMAIDMYLPALPALEVAFAADTAAIQRTLAVFFLGYAVGQAFYGPLLDRFGRKRPLYAGLAVFVLASLGCAVAPSVEAFTALRLLQALGACAGVVAARAMVRDLFEPIEAARMFSALILVMGAAPILAPLAGGYVLVHLGWPAIFLVLAGFGLACLGAARFRLRETHRSPARALMLGAIIAEYARLAADRRFLGPALTGGLCLAGLFAYIPSAPFVFITLHGVPPEDFGWIFGANAVGYVAGAQISGRIVRRFGPGAIAARGVVVMAGAALCLMAAAATGVGGTAGLIVPLFVGITALGFVLPNAAALAMAPFGHVAGYASALLGCLQFGLGAMASTLVGLIHDGTAMPMATIFAVLSVAGLVANRCLVARATP